MNFVWRQSADATDEDMARAAQKPLNEVAVARYSDRLSAARTDRTAFDRAYGELEADKSLKSPELVAIAKAYAGAARKITSRTSALDAIRKRFVELVRFEGKNELAAKSRPW